MPKKSSTPVFGTQFKEKIKIKPQKSVATRLQYLNTNNSKQNQ